MDIMHMIPSRDMRQCLIKNNYQFSDKEILAFLYDRSKSVPELFGHLREFISDCKDPELVRIVASYIKDVETDNERFRQNTALEGRIFQCVIYCDDGSEKGQIYTYDYDIAYQFGISYQESFTIRKIPIVTKPVTKGAEPDDEWKYYNEKGELIESSVETPEVFYSPIYAPHPFRTGDIIRVVAGYNMGVKGVVRLPDHEVPVYEYSDYVLYAETYDEELKAHLHFHPFPFDIELYD